MQSTLWEPTNDKPSLGNIWTPKRRITFAVYNHTKEKKNFCSLYNLARIYLLYKLKNGKKQKKKTFSQVS